MRYEMMLPDQIRMATDQRWPVVLPLGVLEYHGEHMAVGMDSLAVTGVLNLLEREMNLVILPPFYYGAASYAVEPPERNGTLHVDAEASLPFVKAMFQGLLRIGFATFMWSSTIRRRTSASACRRTSPSSSPRVRPSSRTRKGARRGMVGRLEDGGLLCAAGHGDDPFNWIKAPALMAPEDMDGYPFDHAGQRETSLMMALFPEAVDLSKASDDKWYARSAKDATVARGTGRYGGGRRFF